MPTLLAFTFLSPVPGVIAGALAGLAVLAFYFLKLRRRPVRVSSTMLWDQAASDLQVNAPFQMLKPSLLLLLQLLAVAALAAALARPAVDRPLDAESAVLLIDRSASMNARDAGPPGAAPITRLDDAKERAVELVRRLPSETRISVIAFAQSTRSIISDDANRSRVIDAIRSIEPTDQPADLVGALRVVAAFVQRAGEAADEQAAPPLLALVSDGSFETSLSATPAALAGVRTEFLRAGPPPDATPGRNLAITDLSARRDFNDPAQLRVFVRVASNDPSVSALRLIAAIDGEVVDAAPVRLEADAIDAPAGQTGSPAAAEPTPPAAPRSARTGAHTFILDNPGGGLLTVAIPDADDALSADDSVSLVLPPPEDPVILLVQPEDDALTPGGAALADALEATGPRRLDSVRLSIAQRDDLLRRPAVEQYDLVVFDRVTPPSLPPTPTLSFDAALPIDGYGLAPSADAGRVVRVAFWLREHPVMRAVTLGDVLIESPRAMSLPGDQDAEATSDTDPDSDQENGDADADDSTQSPSRARAVTLAAGPRGPLIVLLEAGRHRHVAAGFSLDDTDWWRTLSFPLFIDNAVDFLALRPGARSGVGFSSAETVAVFLPDGVDEATLTGPGGFAAPLRPGPDGRVVMAPLPRVGVYSVQTANDAAAIDPSPADTLVAVNLLSPSESALAAPAELELGRSPVRATTAAGLAPQEVWHWFVLAAAALLVAEWLLYARRLAG